MAHGCTAPTRTIAIAWDLGARIPFKGSRLKRKGGRRKGREPSTSLGVSENWADIDSGWPVLAPGQSPLDPFYQHWNVLEGTHREIILHPPWPKTSEV